MGKLKNLPSPVLVTPPPSPNFSLSPLDLTLPLQVEIVAPSSIAKMNFTTNNTAVAHPMETSSSHSTSSFASSSSSFTSSTGPDGVPHSSSNQAAFQAASFAAKGVDGVVKSGSQMQTDASATKDGQIVSSSHHQAASGLPMDPLSRAAIQGQQMLKPPIPNPLPQLQVQTQQLQQEQQQQQQQQQHYQQRDAHSKCHSVRCTPPPSPTQKKCHETLNYTTKNLQQEQLQQHNEFQQQLTTIQQQQRAIIQKQQLSMMNGDIQQEQNQTENKPKKCHEEVTHREKKHSRGKKCHEHVVTTTKNYDQILIQQQLLQQQQTEMQL